jgi:tetratricopeptide (TPR) repeat protein
MKMGKVREANACFYKLIDYGERHLRDHVRIDYFAVSLPDFLIFEDDLNVRNEAHCYYLMGLGKLGLGKKGEAAEDLEKVLERDPGHQNGILYREMALR